MKKLILGLFVGLILGMSTNAFAAIENGVEAVFANFNYTVNGEAAEQDVTVLVYEGSSYLKTTEIGGMLGYEVSYEADSRTIQFSKPDPTPQPVGTTPNVTPEPTPTTSPIPSPLPTDAEGNVIPTPTPDPNATPAPSTEPTASGDPSPTPSLHPTPTVTPSPTPAPSNAAQCQAIRDDYSVRIGQVGYEGGPEGPKRLKIINLQYERDQKLSAAGC